MTDHRLRSLLALLFALVLSTPLAAQQRWEPANNGLAGGTVRSFGFSNRGDVYAGGEDGIYRLVDGNHWEMLHREVEAYWFMTAPDGTMLMLARATSPGAFYSLYRSNDHGRVWMASLDLMYVGNCRIAPDGTLYMTTLNGLLRSPDMGASWDTLATPAATRSGNAMGMLAIENDGTLILTPNDSSFYVSTNRGASWTFTGKSLPLYYIYNLSILPDGRLEAIGNDTVPYVSTDRGRSWEPCDTMLLGRIWPMPNGDHLLYRAYQQYRPFGGALFRSSDTGRSWRQIDSGQVQGIDVAPDGTIWRSRIPYCYRSTDGGESWENVTAGMDDINPTTPVMDASGNMYLTRIDDVLEDYYEPNFVAYYALFHSSDNGSSWRKVSDSMKQSISVDDAGRIYATVPLDDSSGYFWTQAVSRDGGQSWQKLYKSNLNMMTVQRDGAVMGLVGNDFAISLDGGTTWREISPPVAMRSYHRTEGGVIIAHLYFWDRPDSATGIYRSLDNGITWQPVITGTERNEFIFSSDPGGTIYFAGDPHGTDGYGRGNAIYRSTDNGATFEKTLDSMMVVQLSPTAHGTMLASSYYYSAGVRSVKSTDRGASWTPLFPTRPDSAGIRIQLLTTGTDGSIYSVDYSQARPRLHRSRDDGETWEPFDNGLPSTSVIGLLDPPGKPLFIALRRGIYRMENRSSTAPSALTESAFSFDILPNPLEDRTSIVIDLPSREHLRVTLHDMLGRTIGVLADDEHEAGRFTLAFETGELAAGSYIICASAGRRTTSRVVIVR